MFLSVESTSGVADVFLVQRSQDQQSSSTTTVINNYRSSLVGRNTLGRALKNHNFWLTFGYVSILLLMAQAYA